MTDPFARLGLAMVRWRWPVLVVWLILIVGIGGLLAPKAEKTLRGGGFIDPSSSSAQAAAILDREFNAAPLQTAVVVFPSTTQSVDDPAFQASVTDAAQRLSAVPGVRSVETFYSDGNPLLVSPNRRTTFALVVLEGDESELQQLVPELRAALADVSAEHYVTGFPALTEDLSETTKEDLSRSELFTIPIVIILLLFVFRTVIAAAIPLIVGAGSVVIAMGLLYLIGRQTDVSIFALNVASMIGLGLGIDFSLIVVKRYREEVAAGRNRQEAAAITMATAGRSITFSGITVLLAMFVLTLIFRNLIIVGSISLGVMLVSATALLAGLTLLPAVLSLLGHRIEWLRVMPRGREPRPGEEGFWYKLSHRIMRRPWLWLGVSLGLLILLALPALDFKVSGARAESIPASKESVRGIAAIESAFGASRLAPIQIVIRTPDRDGIWSPQFLDALKTLTERVQSDPRNEQVISLYTLASNAGLPPDQFRTITPELVTSTPQSGQLAARTVNLNGANDTAVITIFSRYDQYSDQHQDFVRELRDTVIPGLPQLQIYDVKVGGSAADFIDLRDAIYGRFPLLIGAVALVTFVVLMMFFQSVLLPIKAILMNLASILATYGVLVLIFGRGWGDSLLGFSSVGTLSVFPPIILFAVLFALSTDYEVFMLSRVKEYYHVLGDNKEAVAAGLEHTAGVITAAGLILIGTFGSFATGQAVPLKEIGIGLAIGVLIDSTIVRVIMVPAAMVLMGNLNWWMPAWLRRIVPELREGPAPELAPIPAVAAASGPSPQDGAVAASPGISLILPANRIVTEAPRTFTRGVLRPIGGSVGTDEIVLPRYQPFSIGRNEENDLQLYDPRISGKHATIEFWRGAFFITDLNSTNGVFINDRPIAERTVLRQGDIIEIGNMRTVLFRYELQTMPVLQAAAVAH